MSWPKGLNQPLSAHFSTKEFECRCEFGTCKTQLLNIDLWKKLEQIREELKAPLIINSAFRCGTHQEWLAQAGHPTARGISQHETGRAADITTTADKMELLHQLAREKFRATGHAPGWVHVDLRTDKERRWRYEA